MSKKKSYPFPNSLFVECLETWYKEAKDNDSKFQYTLAKALRSLKKYPIPLKDGNEAFIIQGIGASLCGMLQEKLSGYNENTMNLSIKSVLHARKHKTLQIRKSIKNVSYSNTTSNNKISRYSVPLSNSNYEIILYIDSTENNSSYFKKYAKDIFMKNGVKIEVIRLTLGDFLWVIKYNNTADTYLFPYIIERKNISDLSHSIKDGRFREQKFRLKRLSNLDMKPILLVESMDPSKYFGLSVDSLKQAIINTMIIDNFKIIFTDNLKHSVNILMMMHVNIIKMHNDLALSGSNNKKHLPLTFPEFSNLTSKNKNLTIKDLFAKHLLYFHGVSVEKAFKISEVYPTFQHLYNGYQSCSDDEEKHLLISQIFKNASNKLLYKNISKHLSIFYN
ncbi:unnamed protein product [Gordionus sp. m RMFG-2023]|uniref:crossover junction endonuclease MUS81-like n=1 Tax=Gordionus sp. m RMFG-2023 TaxID=3053472 RepID=UPI0030E237D8